MSVIGIDTSNYTTSIAFFDGEGGENCSRLLPVRQGELGLRQSDAVFAHIKSLPELSGRLFSHIQKDAITAVGVSTRPRAVEGSYMPCFMVGYSHAKLLSDALGVPLAECADALAKNHGVKGRMEIIPTPGTGYTVLNDYAHKPDALEKVLQSAKAFAKGRVVALFGCGGDRDKTKRPVMGEIGARLADFVIVTSDNPRTEKPEAIIDDILVGLKGYDTPYAVIPDRVAAIHYAMDHAQPGDVIVLAGKGHEDYQEIDHKHYPMDERVIVAEHLKETQK